MPVDIDAGARGVLDHGAVLPLVQEGEDAALAARRVARRVLARRVAGDVGRGARVVDPVRPVGVDLD